MADYRSIAAQKARQYGVPVDVFQRQINQESGFNPNARSGAGAEGIAQFIPSTARAYGLANPYDPVASLDAAARYDRDLIHRYGNVARALSAYNSGRPDAYLDPHFASGQTYNYVRSILGGQGSVRPPAENATVPTRAVAPHVASQNRNIQLALSLLGFSAPPPPAAAQAPSHDASFAGASHAQQIAATLPRSGVGAAIAKTALTQIGIPYQWGGPAKLGSRTDCSGLLQASAAANGVHIGRTTYEQWHQGIPVPLSQLQEGDAVFFHMGPRGPEHVAIYVGGGRVVEDPHTGASVEISQLAGRGAVGARRFG